MALKKYSGYVQRITFESAGFYILRMYIDQKDKSYTVRGNVHGINIHEGSWFAFEGDWDNHPKYGYQLKISRAPVFVEDRPEDAFKLLTTHGIDEDSVEKLMEAFGEDFPSCLSDEDKMKEVLSEREVKEIHDRWKVLYSVFKSLDILSELGLSSEQINNIWKVFPENVYGVLTQNPWALVKVDGITFETCDLLAEKSKISKDSPLRTQGAAMAAIKESKVLGSVFVGTGSVAYHMKKILEDSELSPQLIGQSLKTLHEKKEIVIDNRFSSTAIYEPWEYHMEETSASLLKSRLELAKLSPEMLTILERSLPKRDSSLRERLRQYIEEKKFSGFDLSNLQKEAVVNAVLEPVSIITGGPGSGKTTTLKAVIRALRDFGVNFSIVAPTGVAAKRAQEVTGNEASTIHREFGATGFSTREENSSYEGILSTSRRESSESFESYWEYNSQCPHGADVLIIDETSMKDLHMLYRTLEGTKSSCRIVFVGDVDQLPSVGAGRVLSDLISSELFPTTVLSEIFRQKETSQISFVAKDIRDGKIPEESQMGKDFIFIERGSEEEVLNTILQLSTSLYEKRVNFQVMSPRHGGALGVTNLNTNLRSLINPSKKNRKEVKIGGDSVREEDRIMVFQNDYSLNLYNGDLGKISFISNDRRHLEIKLHENPPRHVKLTLAEAKRLLRLAYATTINKMQGQEMDVVVIPWVKSFGRQLKRKLLYTAVTRAKKRVLLVGHKEAFERAILNGKEETRNSYLKERILDGNRRSSK